MFPFAHAGVWSLMRLSVASCGVRVAHAVFRPLTRLLVRFQGRSRIGPWGEEGARNSARRKSPANAVGPLAPQTYALGGHPARRRDRATFDARMLAVPLFGGHLARVAVTPRSRQPLRCSPKTTWFVKRCRTDAGIQGGSVRNGALPSWDAGSLRSLDAAVSIAYLCELGSAGGRARAGRAHSSAGQSSGLIIRRSQVRALLGPSVRPPRRQRGPAGRFRRGRCLLRGGAPAWLA